MRRNRIVRRARRIASCGIMLAMAAATAPPATAVEAAPGQTTPDASRPDSDELVNAPGRERAVQCGACHSLDYIQMNSRFLDLAGWTAVVNKMINVYGAPIAKTDVDAIARYLTEHYGQP
jgi:mono/diheme cytochrome c family protein